MSGSDAGMAQGRIVIGELSPVRASLPFVLPAALFAVCFWLAYVHGYYRPRYEGLQFGGTYYLPVLIGTAGMMAFFSADIWALLFHGGAGVRIEGGRLIYGRTKIDLAEIANMQVGAEGIFVGVPGEIDFELVDGTSFSIATYGLKTPVPEMLRRLEACGVKVKEPAASDGADKSPELR